MTAAINGYEGPIARYTGELADGLVAVAGVRAGQRALDVGCGGGALTEPLAVARENDGLNWPRCDGLNWPHLRPIVA